MLTITHAYQGTVPSALRESCQEEEKYHGAAILPPASRGWPWLTTLSWGWPTMVHWGVQTAPHKEKVRQ